MVNFIKRTFEGRFHIARLSRLPALRELMRKLAFDGDHLICLPRDEVIQVNAAIAQPEEWVVPSQIVHHFIDVAKHHWIMDFCICRDSTHCEDYPTDLGCLFMGEAVLSIHPSLGRLVTPEEAHAHVRRCREAGLIHTLGRDKLDSIWLGVPGHKLMTVCNCCPCCCLWRMLPDLDPSIAKHVHRLPGVEVRVTEACTGCGACVRSEVCFVRAIEMRDGRVVVTEGCRGCGRCVDLCPQGAVELTLDDPEAIRRAVDDLVSVLDLS
jgi:ferredoxin